MPIEKPSRKVNAGMLAGALSILLVWIVGMFEIKVPAEASSALTTVITFVTSYFVQDAE